MVQASLFELHYLITLFYVFANCIWYSLIPSSGVESYDIDLKEQKVTVKGNVQPDAVLQTVSKTGKKTSFWEAEAPAEPEAKPAETVAAA